MLVLTGAVIDVVSRVPPRNACTGRCDFYLTEVGQATLVLELRDGRRERVLFSLGDEDEATRIVDVINARLDQARLPKDSP